MAARLRRFEDAPFACNLALQRRWQAFISVHAIILSTYAGSSPKVFEQLG